MISTKTLDIDWINKVSAENRKADKILVEKVIHALFLLEGLVKNKIEFVFKGGTSLMLLLNSSKRLSIDIDIILPKEYENLEEIFGNIVKEQGFTKFELQERSVNSQIKKAHYKFFYEPLHKTYSKEEYILLDILFEKVKYKKLIELPINHPFLITEAEHTMVSVPSHEDILGDKLTAFAPTTTGIPYKKGKKSMSMEIIKQLYDVGNLVDAANDIKIVKETFSNFARTELAYRGKSELNENDVLDDSFKTSLKIASRGITGEGKLEELLLGIRRLKGFIFSESFHLDKAVTFASKAAYIATLIKYDAKEIEKFNDPNQLKDWSISEPLWKGANKLKKSNPEAFFYWYKVHELISY